MSLSTRLVSSFIAVRKSLVEYKRSPDELKLLQLDIDLFQLATYLFINKCWRPFINWAGNRSLTNVIGSRDYLLSACKTGRLEQEHIVSLEHRVFHIVRDFFPDQAQDILYKNTACRQVHDLLAQKHSHLAGFSENLLRQYFRKSFKRLVSIYLLTQRMNQLLSSASLTDRDRITTLKEKLEVFAFQYLFHTAKIPLLEQPIPFHLSFLDYLWSNEPSYYRGDGGALINLLLQHLENTPYCFLSQSGAKLGIVTYDQFPFILENLCNKFRDQHFEYHRVLRLEEIQSKLEPSRREVYLVFDVTPLFDLPNPQDQHRIFEAINAKTQEYSRSYPNILIAGAIPINLSIGVYFLFKNDQKIEPIIDVLTNFQSAIGAYPEIVSLRRILVQLGFPLKSLIQMYPFRDEILDDDLLRGDATKTLKEPAQDLSQAQAFCQKALESLPPVRELEKYCKMTQLYIPLLDRFLNSLKTSLSSFSQDLLQNELILQPVFSNRSKILVSAFKM